jgi:Ca2+-binding RTX toxin-like protein
LFDASSYVRTSTSFTAIYSPGNSETFYGTGLTYSASGQFAGGTATSFRGVADGKVAFQISGFKVAATAITAAASTVSTTDDLALMKMILAGNDTVLGNSLDDVIHGYAGHDVLKGSGGDDRVWGDAGDDTMVGGSGADYLSGGAGRDKLRGGLGFDKLIGGTDADSFIFDDHETGASKTTADYILDFRGRLGDKLDLRLVDANVKASGDQAFSFIGTHGFTGAGQIRYEKTSTDTWVYLNTDADTAAEAVIRLKGSFDLAKAWLLL